VSIDVSVIIPVHNRMSYLQAAVDSILNQIWQGELEVIIVADGLDVEPESVLEISEDSNVRILKKTHGGVGAARQHGLENARGRYFAFNDDDDLWLPGKLATQFEILEACPEYDMLFGDLYEFDEHGVNPVSRNTEYPEYKSKGQRHVGSENFPALYKHEPNGLLGVLMNGAGFYFQTVLARRAFVERIGGMDPRTPSCGDVIDFAVRAIHGGTLGYLDLPTFHLRRGHTHMTSSGNFAQREAAEFFAVFPDYPEELRLLLKPWLGHLLLQPAYVYFGRKQFKDAAQAYRKAFAQTKLGLRPGARAKWFISELLSGFQQLKKTA